MKEALLDAIVAQTGLPMRHNNDFKQLCELIFNETHEHISDTTLKRLWGYVSDQDCEPRHTTLDLLARFLGCRNFAHFCELGGVIPVKTELRINRSSDIFLSNACAVEDFEVNEEIIVTWFPDRRCRFRYIGNRRFEVVESENAKIDVGDTFGCDVFINKEPLHIHHLTHDGKKDLLYVVGRNNGIKFRRVVMKEEKEKKKRRKK